MPTLDAPVQELNERIMAARGEARELWARFERTRDELAGTPDAIDQNSDGFKAAFEASKAYDEKAGEIAELQETRDRLLAMSGQQRDSQLPPEPHQATERALRSMADRVLGQDAYRELRNSGVLESREAAVGHRLLGEGATRDELRHMLRPELAHALVTGADDLSGGALITPDRQGFVPLRTRPLRLVDMVTIGSTDSDLVEYVEQTSFTNAAAETAEATATSGTSGTAPESGLGLIVRQTNVRELTHFIPATKRALADAGQLQTLIDGMLRLGLDLRLDGQIISGDGVGENLRGIMNTAGLGTVAKVDAVAGNTNVPETKADAIHRGITVVRLAFHEPTAVALHPNDWQELRLARDGDQPVANTSTTAGSHAKGAYLLGKPQEEVAPQIWGIPVVTGAQFTQNTGLVGDFAQAVLWLRSGVDVLASDSHADFFVRRLVAVLAAFRAAFGVLAPGAFCTVTNI